MGAGRSRSRHRDGPNNRRRGRSPACDDTGSPTPDYTQLGPWAHCNTPEPDDGLLRPSSALSDYSVGRGRAGSAASGRAPSRTLAPPAPDERRGRSQSVAGDRSRANSVASNRAPSAAPRGRARARACSPPPDLPDRGFRRAPRHEDVHPDQIECSELPTTSDLFDLLELDPPVPPRTHPFIRTDTFNVVTDERWFNLARRAFPGDILFIGSVILTEWWLACDLLPTELAISLRELVCDRVSLAPSVDTKEAERIVKDLWDYLRGTRCQLRNLDRFCEKRVEVAIPERPSDDLDETGATQPEQVMVDFFRQVLAPYSNQVRQFFLEEKAAATKAKHQDILTRTPPIDKAIIAICWLVIFGIRGAYECEGVVSGDYCLCPYHVRLSKSMVIADGIDGHAQEFSHFNWAKLCAWWFCHVEVIIPRIEPAPKTADLFITKSNDPQPKVPAYNPAQHNKKKKPRLPDHNAPPPPANPSTLQPSSTGDPNKNPHAPHHFDPALHADKATSPSPNQSAAVLPPNPTMVKNQPVGPKRGGYNVKVPPPKPQPGTAGHAFHAMGSLPTAASSAMVTATPNPAPTSSARDENKTVVLRDQNKVAVPATNVPQHQQAQVNTGTVKAKKRNKAKAAAVVPPAAAPPAAVVPYAATPALSVPPSNYASSSDGSTLAEDLPVDKLSSDIVHLSLHYAPSGATMVDIRQDTAFSMLLSTWSSKVASDHAKASTIVGSPPTRFMFIWNNQSLKLNDTPKGVGMSHHEAVTVLDSTDVALAMECLDPYFFQEVARSITHRRIYGNGFNLSPELRNLSSLVTEMWEKRIQTAPSKLDQRIPAAPPKEPTFDQLYTPGNLGYSSVDTSTLRTSGWGERGLLHGDFGPAASKRE